MVSASGVEALRQDFSDSDKDRDLRRTAMDALKGHLELLDMKTMPDFSEQGSEGREVEASRHYAISLYSELAKVHKHEVIPFIPRMMASVVRSLPSSGGSQQLQQACAKVVTSLARYTIDPTKPPSSNEEIIRSLCSPLLPALSSKSEPLSTGAAVCLQALVESEKWKCAPLDLQDLLCAKVTSALTEKATQTVAHMHLMRSLAKFNSFVVQQYGEKLLRAGMDILQAASGTSESWHQRVAAIQLLGAVLKIADAETLDLDLSPIMGILEGCRLDKVAGVRTLAGDALETAKVVAAEIDLRHDVSSEDADAERTKVYLLKNHIKRTHSKMEGTNVQEFLVLPSPNRGTPSEGTASTESLDKFPKRSPLFPVKQSRGNPTCTSFGTRSLKSSKFKENAPAENPSGGFSGLIALSKIRNDSRDLSDARMSKDLAPKHQNSSNLQCLAEDSGIFYGVESLRGSFADLQTEGADPMARDLHEKVTGNENNGVDDWFCSATIRGTMKRKQGIVHESSLNKVYHPCSPDFTKKSRGNTENGTRNMIACSKGTSDNGEPCKDGNTCGESEDCKDSSRASNRSVGLAENVLCNGCVDHQLTPDSKESITSQLTVHSDNGENIQIAQSLTNIEDGHVYTFPRSLVLSMPSDGIEPKLKQTSGDLKDCTDAKIETSSETSWSVRGNLISGESEEDCFDENQKVCRVSQNGSGTASSSCCSLEELDSRIGRHVRVCMQVEEQSLWRKEKDCKCLSALLDRLNMEEAKQCQLSVKEGSEDLSSVDRDEKSGGMQFLHDDVRVNDEGISFLKIHKGQVESRSRRTECSEETMWSFISKVMRKAQSFTGTSSGIVVHTIVILVVASILIRYLSSTRDLHVLVPT